LGFGKTEIFFQKGLDTLSGHAITDLPVGQNEYRADINIRRSGGGRFLHPFIPSRR
jgi:hypothetical protein